jgi:hypothetical protein
VAGDQAGSVLTRLLPTGVMWEAVALVVIWETDPMDDAERAMATEDAGRSLGGVTEASLTQCDQLTADAATAYDIMYCKYP